MLLGISRWLQRSESRERMHPVHQTCFFHRAPHAVVLGLNRIIAHRIDWADQSDSAALVRDAINLLRREFRILHWEHRREEQTFGVLLAVFISPLVVGL